MPIERPTETLDNRMRISIPPASGRSPICLGRHFSRLLAVGALLFIVVWAPAWGTQISGCALTTLANQALAGHHRALARLQDYGAHGDGLAQSLVALYYGTRFYPIEALSPGRQHKLLASARAAARSGNPIGFSVYGADLLRLGDAHQNPGLRAHGARLLKRSLPLLRIAAHKSCAAPYQFILSRDYSSGIDSLGIDVPKNAHKAFLWDLRAAEGGDSMAQETLGVSYVYAQGVKQNCAAGLRWLRLSIQHGFSQSMTVLGQMYDRGVCVTKSRRHAIALYRRAARVGDQIAEADLGFCYIHGLGVPRNLHKAILYLGRASDQGNLWARAERINLNEFLVVQRMFSWCQASHCPPAVFLQLMHLTAELNAARCTAPNCKAQMEQLFAKLKTFSAKYRAAVRQRQAIVPVRPEEAAPGGR